MPILQTRSPANHKGYTALLLFIAGMGGLLYGYDLGIIAPALLYLGKTISLTIRQESLVVAAVLGGGMISSLVAGVLADFFGRKKVMIAAAVMFVASIVLIVSARGFPTLFAGRVMQGLSVGMIALVIPLYLAECLPAGIRGRGTAAVQLLLTIGILASLAIGTHYTRVADRTAGVAAAGSPELFNAQDQAWRAMFRSAIYPSIVFLVGSFFITESPRWLYRRGRPEQALAALRKSRSSEQAEGEFREMEASLLAERAGRARSAQGSSIFQRKYIVAFILACAVIGLTQATGVNSILQFVVVILQQAGLPASAAADRATLITAVNVAFTIVGLLLVDRIGRRALLKIGTAGITVSLLASAFVFHEFESQRVDVTAAVRRRIEQNAVNFKVAPGTFGRLDSFRPVQISVLYAYGGNERLAAAFSNSPEPFLKISPDAKSGEASLPLTIKRAKYGAIPDARTGNVVMACLMVFIASFATGPGVCVWLALPELLPTRIRSLGMGVSLLINQGVSTGIAAAFLPFVGNFGYSAIFIFWAGFTAVYFITVALFLPETKGKTLEEIEDHFAAVGSGPGSRSVPLRGN